MKSLDKKLLIKIIIIIIFILIVFFNGFDIKLFTKIAIIGGISYFLISFSSKNKTKKEDDDDYFKDLK